MKKQCHLPFSPSRLPFFYGWVILVAGIVGVMMSIPGQTMGVSVFTENLLKDLEISRNNLSLAYLVGTMSSGLLITRAGKLYDRYGARVMAFSSGVFLGLVLVYLTRVDRIAQWLGNDRLLSISLFTFLLLSLGFFGIRFFGQGMLTMVSRNMVMKWFDKRRGMANAVLGIFTAMGFALAPQLLDQVIQRFEWRGAWIALALMVGVAFALFVLVIYRDNPEGCGLRADGKLRERKGRKRPQSLPEKDFTLVQARKTLAFWAFSMGLAIASMYISGLTFHIVSVFESSGMSRAQGLAIFIPTSIIAVVVQFVCSYISDFVKLKYLLILFLAGMLLTSVGLTLLGQTSMAYWMVITGNGIGWGLYAVLVGVTWPRFYGLKNLGAISGFSMSWTVIASALGPYLFSLSFNWTGNYDAVGWLTLGITCMVLLLAFRADLPLHPDLKEEH